MRQLVFILVVSGFCFASCGQTYDKKAIALNEQAMSIRFDNSDSALVLLDKATRTDPTYYLAYSNMASIFVERKDFKSAIASMEKSVAAKPELAEGVTFLGMLNDFSGNSQAAKELYQRSIDIYDERLKKPDEHEQANKVNKAWTYVLLGDSTKGRAQLNDLLKENPDDITLQMFVKMDKQEYLENLFGKK